MQNPLAQRYLSTVVRYLNSQSSERFLDPARKGISLDLDFEDSRMGQSAFMSRFYDAVTAGIFGGDLVKTVAIEDDDDINVRVDVYDSERKVIYEVKAARSGHEFGLRDSQMYWHRRLQLYDPELKLYFAFYRHDVREVQSRTRSIDELVDELRSSNQYCLVLPLSVILALHKGDSEFTKRYKRKDNEEEGTTIITSAFSAIAYNPLEFISELKLNPDNYCVDRYRLERNLRISGRTNERKYKEWKLGIFPIVKISEREEYHPEFIARLRNAPVEGVPF